MAALARRAARRRRSWRAFRAELAARAAAGAGDAGLLRRVRRTPGSTRWTRCGSPPAPSRWPPTTPVAIVAQCPAIVAAYWRLRHGADAGAAPRRPRPRRQLPLHARRRDPRTPERVRGLETYLNTVVDHGLNASTFTARVITSTGSDLVSAVVGALGALKGPLHGGAPGPALDMVFEIGEASRAEAVLRDKVAARREADGLRPPRLQGARSAGRRAGRGRRAAVHPGRRHGALPPGPRRSRPPRCACSRSTSPAAGCRPTSSSTPRCCCTASASTPACSRRPSPSAGSAAGSPTPPSSAAPTASSGRSRSTSGRAGGGGGRSPCRPALNAPSASDARGHASAGHRIG